LLGIDNEAAASLVHGLANPADELLFPRSSAPPSPARPASALSPQRLAGHPVPPHGDAAPPAAQARPPAPATPTPPPSPTSPRSPPALAGSSSICSPDALLARLWWGAGLAAVGGVRRWFAAQDGLPAQPGCTPLGPPAHLAPHAALALAAAVLQRCRRQRGPGPAPQPPSGQPWHDGGLLALMAADLLVRLLARHPAALLPGAPGEAACGLELLPALLRAAELLLGYSAPQQQQQQPQGARPPSPPPSLEALPTRAAAGERLAALCGALEAQHTLQQLLPLALGAQHHLPPAVSAAALLRLLRLLYGAQLLRKPLALALALQHAQRLWRATSGFTRPPTFQAVAAGLQEDLAGALAFFRPQVRAGAMPCRATPACAPSPPQRARTLHAWPAKRAAAASGAGLDAPFFLERLPPPAPPPPHAGRRPGAAAGAGAGAAAVVRAGRRPARRLARHAARLPRGPGPHAVALPRRQRRAAGARAGAAPALAPLAAAGPRLGAAAPAAAGAPAPRPPLP
jgi:hypothetical protein